MKEDNGDPKGEDTKFLHVVGKVMDSASENLNFGLLDNRFLAKSVGLLNPRSPITIKETAPLREALSVLKSNRIGGVIVTDVTDRITGIFTERDVVLKVLLENFKLSTPVSEVMTAEPQVIKMTNTIAFALQMMSDQGYRHLPIVDDDRIPIGIISVKDIMDYIAKSLTRALIDV